MKNKSNNQAYRKLRTNIEYRNDDKNIKSICLTSCNHGAGTTTVACNLAITSAANKSKVLLIDANISNPQIHKVFNMNMDTGLTNILRNHDYSNVMYYTSKFKDNHSDGVLYVMGAGSKISHSLDVLSSEAFKDFMIAMNEVFDFIIIDCPSIETSYDVIPVTHVVDGTVLVISSLDSDKNKAKDALKQLHRNGAYILGTVLNKVVGD